MFHLPSLPVILLPSRIGTLFPFESKPIVLEWKGNGLREIPPKPNFSASSRKKARFSGKNKGNLVVLTCLSSTSVSAKSVCHVIVAVKEGVRR